MPAVARVVHQIWYNFADWGAPTQFPARYKDFRQSWQERNPGWTLLLWDERQTTNFLAKFYPALLTKFLRFPTPIQRVDFVKWVLIWHFGGCYADTDCICTHPLDALLKPLSSDQPLLIIPSSAWAANACLVATARHHAAVWDIITHMPIHNLLGPHSVAGVFLTTGPAFIRLRLANQPNVLVSHSLLWHQPDGRRPKIPIVATHVGDGTWGYQKLLALDILRLIAAVLIIILSITILALFTTNVIRRVQLIKSNE